MESSPSSIMDGRASNGRKSTLLGASTSSSYYNTWFQLCGMWEDCSAARMLPKVIFLLGVVVEVLQLLTFSIGTRYGYDTYIIKELTFAISATIVPIWDTEHYGYVDYTVYAVFVYVMAALCVGTAAFGALLMARQLQNAMTEVSRVVGTLAHCISSWLYLPIMHLFLAGLGCAADANSSNNGNSNSKHVIHFPQQQCYSGFHIATLTVAIVGLVALFAVAGLMTAMMGDVRLAAAHLRSRPHNQVELLHFIILTALVISQHLLIPYGHVGVYSIFVLIGMVISVALHSYALPFYNHAMNLVRSTVGCVVIAGAIVNICSAFWKVDDMGHNVLVESGQNSFLLACLVPFALLVGYAVGDVRPCNELRGKVSTLLHTGTVPVHEALFPFPKSKLTFDLKFTAPRFQLLESEILTEYEDIMMGMGGMRSGSDAGSTNSGGGAGSNRRYSNASTSTVHYNSTIKAMNDALDEERKAYRIATHCQILVPYINKVRAPWDAEVSSRFVKLQSDVTGLPASPFAVAFASRIFIKCLLLWRSSGVVKCAFANFLFARTKRFRLALDLVEEVDGQVDGDHDLMTLYIAHKIGHEIRDLSGIRDEVRTVALNRARFNHKEALVDTVHFWSKLMEARGDIVGLSVVCSHITNRRLNAQSEYERFLLTQRPDGVVLSMYAAFLEHVIGDDLATDEFKRLAVVASEEKRARIMKRGGQSTVSVGADTATSRATAKLIENLHDATDNDRQAHDETFSATVSAKALMRIISIFLLVIGGISIVAFVLQRVRISAEETAIDQIRRVGVVRSSVEKQRYLIMRANEAKLNCFISSVEASQGANAAVSTQAAIPILEQLVSDNTETTAAATTTSTYSATTSSLLLCSDTTFLGAVKALSDEEVRMRGTFNMATIGPDYDTDGATIGRFAMQAVTQRSVPLRSPIYSEVFNVQPCPFIVADAAGIASSVVRTGTFSQFSQSAADAVVVSAESPWMSITILSQKVTEAVNNMAAGGMYGDSFAWVTSADNVAYIADGMSLFIDGLRDDVVYDGNVYLGVTIALLVVAMFFFFVTYYAFYTNLQRAAMAQLHRLQLFALVPYSTQSELCQRAKGALELFERMSLDGDDNGSAYGDDEDDQYDFDGDEDDNTDDDQTHHNNNDGDDRRANANSPADAFSSGGRANAVVHHPTPREDPWASSQESPLNPTNRNTSLGKANFNDASGTMSSITPSKSASQHQHDQQHANNTKRGATAAAATAALNAAKMAAAANAGGVGGGHNATAAVNNGSSPAINPLVVPHSNSIAAAATNRNTAAAAAAEAHVNNLWTRATAGGGPMAAAAGTGLLAAPASQAHRASLIPPTAVAAHGNNNASITHPIITDDKGARRMRMFKGGNSGSGNNPIGGISGGGAHGAKHANGVGGMGGSGVYAHTHYPIRSCLKTPKPILGTYHSNNKGGERQSRRRVAFNIEGIVIDPNNKVTAATAGATVVFTSPASSGTGGPMSPPVTAAGIDFPASPIIGGGPKRKLKERYEPIPEGIVADFENSLRQAQREVDEEDERDRIRSEKVIFGGLRAYQMGRKRAMEIARQRNDDSLWNVSTLSVWIRAAILIPIVIALALSACGLSIGTEVWQRNVESVRVATAATDLVSQLRELRMETMYFISSGRIEHYHSFMSRLQNREFFAGAMRAVSRSKAINADTATHVIGMQRISERIIYDMVVSMTIAGRAIAMSSSQVNAARGVVDISIADIPILGGISWISSGVDEPFAKTFPAAATDPLGYVMPSLPVLKNNYIAYRRQLAEYNAMKARWGDGNCSSSYGNHNASSSSSSNSSSFNTTTFPPFTSRFKTLSEMLQLSIDTQINRTRAVRYNDAEEGGETTNQTAAAGAAVSDEELLTDGSILAYLNMSNIVTNSTEELMRFARLRITSQKIDDDFEALGTALSQLFKEHGFMKRFEASRVLNTATETDPLRSDDAVSATIATAESYFGGQSAASTSTDATEYSTTSVTALSGESTSVNGGLMVGRFGVGDEQLMERYGAIKMTGVISGVGGNAYRTSQSLLLGGFACACVALGIIGVTFIVCLMRQIRHCLRLNTFRTPRAIEIIYFVFLSLGLIVMAVAVALTASTITLLYSAEYLHEDMLGGLAAYEQAEKRLHDVFVNRPAAIITAPLQSSSLNALKYYDLYQQRAAVGLTGDDTSTAGNSLNPSDGNGMLPWLDKLADALDVIASNNDDSENSGDFVAFRSSIGSSVLPALTSLSRIHDVSMYIRRCSDLKYLAEQHRLQAVAALNDSTLAATIAEAPIVAPPSPPWISDYNLATEPSASSDLSQFTDFTNLRYSSPAVDIFSPSPTTGALRTGLELSSMARAAVYGARGLSYLRGGLGTLRDDVFEALLLQGADGVADRADNTVYKLTVACGLLGAGVIIAVVLFLIPWAMFLFSTRKGISRATDLLDALFKDTLRRCQIALLCLALLVATQFTLFFLSTGVGDNGAVLVNKGYQRETLVAQCYADAINLRYSARNANVFEAVSRAQRLVANANTLMSLRNDLYYDGGAGSGRYGRAKALSDAQRALTFEGAAPLDRLHSNWLAAITALGSASYNIVPMGTNTNVTRLATLILQQGSTTRSGTATSASSTTAAASAMSGDWTSFLDPATRDEVNAQVNYSSITAPNFLREHTFDDDYLALVELQLETLRDAVNPLLSSLRASNMLFVADVKLAMDETLAPDVILLVAVLVVIFLQLRVVIRPVGDMLVEHETGARLLLTTIPTAIRELIPRVQLYMDTGDLSDTAIDAETHDKAKSVISAFKGAWQRGEAAQQCFAILDDDDDHGLIVIAADGIVQHVNPAVGSLLGFSNADIAGLNVGVMMAEPLRANHDAFIRRYLLHGNPRVVGSGRDTVALSIAGEHVPIYLQVFDAVRDDGSMYFVGQIDRYVSAGTKTLGGGGVQ